MTECYQSVLQVTQKAASVHPYRPCSQQQGLCNGMVYVRPRRSGQEGRWIAVAGDGMAARRSAANASDVTLSADAES